MSKQMVVRQAHDEFGAFKICEAALKSGGEVVSVTVAPVMVFDHLAGYAKPEGTGRQTWIVWMTFDAEFNPDVLDAAIETEDR